MHARHFSLGIFVIASLAGHAAAVPLGTAITYQGQLKHSGVPYAGSADLIFTLYDDVAVGNVVAGPLTLTNVSVVSGLFTVQLDFGAAAYAGAARWLEIQVATPSGNASYAKLTPRQAMTAAPYSLFAAAPWVSSGGNVSYTAGNVGIGTSTPTAKLQIGGTAGTDGIKFPDGTLQVSAATGGSSFWSANGSNIYNNNTGSVGIGTQTPIVSLEVKKTGNTLISGGALGVTADQTPFPAAAGKGVFLTGGNASYGNVFAFNYTTFQPLALVLQAPGGHVGIGTTSPGSPLTVVGSGPDWAVYGQGQTGGIGVAGSASGGAGARGVFGTVGAGGFCGTSGDHYGSGFFGLLGTQNEGVYGYALGAKGVHGVGNNGGYGVYGESDYGSGVYGTSGQYGVYANGSYGVYATGSNTGVYATGQVRGVQGFSTNTSGFSAGVYGSTANAGAGGWGVYSLGAFGATGTKSFQIDHPLDPTNKYLMHYCTEGPEPLNVYRGNATLDAQGQAWVTLPDYFDQINRDPSYQLTAIGKPALALHIDKEIDQNRFLIAGGAPGQKVSWRVEAVRNDLFVRTYGAPVEQDKPQEHRGKYLQPELYRQPKEKGQFYRPATPPNPPQ